MKLRIILSAKGGKTIDAHVGQRDGDGCGGTEWRG